MDQQKWKAIWGRSRIKAGWRRVYYGHGMLQIKTVAVCICTGILVVKDLF